MLDAGFQVPEPEGFASSLQSYSRNLVAEVLAANDIVDIVKAVVELKPAGNNDFKGLCPFHNEKTPSFTVSRSKQLYYCFGCQAGGDAVAFLRELEHLSFAEALQRLADRAGITLPAPDGAGAREQKERSALFELGALARRYYRELLGEPLRGSKARGYLKQRQFDSAMAAKFQLGYAPDDWQAFANYAREKGYSEDLLVRSGLCARKESRGRCYDFFRDRLMFPICDVAGNVAAFGGRDLSGTAPGKYINTPEGPVYKKGRMLYGLYEAREALRKAKQALIVEGYFDVIRCVEAGFSCTVAPCGTALTADQARLLLRYVPEVVMVFDGDAAGIRAALRSVGLLVAAGLGVRAVALPDGQDPDDYIRAEGAESFKKRIESAPNFVTFYVKNNSDRLNTIEGRSEVARDVFSILLGMDDGLRRDEYLKLLARELGADKWQVQREFAKAAARRRQGPPPEVQTAVQKANFRPMHVNADECAFVAVLLDQPQVLAAVRETLADEDLGEGALAEVLRALFDDVGPGLFQRLETDEARSLVAEAAGRNNPGAEKAEKLVKETLASFRRKALRREAAQLQESLREAERNHDVHRLQELLARKAMLRNELDKAAAG